MRALRLLAVLLSIVLAPVGAQASDVTIQGRVCATDGAPIPNPIIIAVREMVDPNAGIERRLAALVRLQDQRTLPVSVATGDVSGAFVLAAGSELRYRLFVVAAGYAPAVLLGVPNPTQDLVVQLQPGIATQGLVVDHDGEPIADAEVELFLAPPDPVKDPDIVELVMSRLLPPLWKGRSDADGRFGCPYGMKGMALRAVARKGGFQQGDGLGVSERPIHVTLERGLLQTGVVVGPDARPLVGAEVQVTLLLPGRSTPMGAPVLSAVTGADGAFVIDGLPKGEHRILVYHPEYGAYRHQRFRVSDQPAKFRLARGRELDIKLRDFQTREPIVGASVTVEEGKGVVRSGVTNVAGVFTVRGLPTTGQPEITVTVSAASYATSRERLTLAGPDTERRIRLHRAMIGAGSVVDENDQPVSGATVFMQESVGTLKAPADEAVVKRTDKAGQFAFTDVAPKKLYFYRVVCPGYLAAEGEAFLVTPGVELPSARLVLLRPLAVVGVVRGLDGKPISGAAVGVLGTSNLVERVEQLELRDVADTGGRFRIAGLPAGSHRLLIQADGYRSQHGVTVKLVRGAVNEVTIDLVVSAELTGTVVDTDGNPVADAAITVIDTTDGLLRLDVKSDDAGKFRVPNLGGFPVTVKAEKPGVGDARLEEVPLGEPVVITLK